MFIDRTNLTAEIHCISLQCGSDPQFGTTHRCSESLPPLCSTSIQGKASSSYLLVHYGTSMCIPVCRKYAMFSIMQKRSNSVLEHMLFNLPVCQLALSWQSFVLEILNKNLFKKLSWNIKEHFKQGKHIFWVCNFSFYLLNNLRKCFHLFLCM